jgi:hypothetical protein
LSISGLEMAYNQALRATFYLAAAVAGCTVILAILIPGRRLTEN